MMELAHSLLLNEDALKRISDSKKPVFVFEWLRFLDKVLVAAQKSDIKESQKKLIEQLTQQISENAGPPTRKLLARCLATLFSVGDTFALFETINKCNDVVRNKDDSPSYLPTRLAAVCCIGGMYEKLGRMVGRSYEETVQLLIKALRNAESQGRYEIMLTLEKVIEGLGSAGGTCYKDIYKAGRNCMTDRTMHVRCAAAKCMIELVKEAPFMYTTEVDNVASLCFRALDGSTYDVRCEVANLLGVLLSTTQSPRAAQAQKGKQMKIEDMLNILANGFLRGGNSFLKAGEMIKGSAAVNREVRVGVTHAYVELARCMGGRWLERNASVFLHHILYLVASPKATPTHVDAVYARKCVNFILRSVIGGMMGEKVQIAAAKEICQVIIKQMNASDAAAESGSKDAAGEFQASQHVLVCALHELGSLVQALGTAANQLVSEPATGIIEPVVSVLIHPSGAARLASAWCLRSISKAVPSQLTPLIDRCMNRMVQLKSSPEAISGYSFALAALLGGVHQCPLGVPHAKGKQIFNIAEEVLRTASQNSRLSLQRTQSGWLLLGSLMTLGPSVVRNHLPRMLLLWRNAFPRSTKELESEKARGDAFTWQVTLEGRAGALCAMHSFVLHCPELVTEDVTRRLLPPLECALTMMAHIPGVIKQHGAHLKAPAAMVRLRLYDVLCFLPPENYEGAFSPLLRELVAEFTLTDNPANTTTSLLRSMCHVDDSVILGSWLEETDHKAIEDQLEPNRRLDKVHLQPNSASGSGALEHDAASLYFRCSHSDIPGPLPLGVAVIDSSVRLYGLVFPRVAHKHRLQMLEHFSECIKQAKSQRQQAVQINIFTAVLSALKGLAESKTGFGQDDVRKAAVTLVMGALHSSNPILRCAAGEALGRMAQVVGDSRFIAEMAQYSFDRLKSARDVVSRTGHSLALGCLHRYVGGMGSGQHLNTSVSILLALAQDTTSPVVQVWALHALALIADSGGPMFRGYVEPTLNLVLTQLLSVPPSNVDVHQCLGKCLAALITTIGPELQSNTGSVATARLYCLICCGVMQDHSDSLVQAEAISCLQQLHMFAPRHVNLTTLVPHLCATLTSSHLLLRRAGVACLRQLSQREAREVCDHAMTLVADKDAYYGDAGKQNGVNITETGLEGALFSLLDTETDVKLCSDVRDTLISMLQTLAIENLSRWLLLLKDVLQATDSSSTPTEQPGDVKNDEEDEDDDVVIQIKDLKEDVTHPNVAPRWPTRVFAVECLNRIINVCEDKEEHFDYVKAKELRQQNPNSDYLVLHLSELVRMSFIAATSDSDPLRLAGLAALQDIVTEFALVPEPEFPGHVILEQYQAQVGAALRPAFSADTPPDVTAAACDVCSTWIGSGVAHDLNDLRRVHQLLVQSLQKLKAGKGNSQLYSESASTMEKLAVLKAWAEVYIVAMNRETEREKPRNQSEQEGSQEEENGDGRGDGESLLNLVQPELSSLSKHWLAALKDHALLSLPPEYGSQLPPEGGTFYNTETMDSARPHYKKSWPPILYAASLWLNNTGFANVSSEKPEPSLGGNPLPSLSAAANAPANMNPEEINSDRFHLLLGISIEALCSPTSIQPLDTVVSCLKAVNTLLDSYSPRSKLGADPSLAIELLNVLHRLLLTRENLSTQLLVMSVVQLVILSAQEGIEADRQRVKDAENKPANDVEGSTDSMDTIDSTMVIGEGGESGDIIPGKSVVFATLEVCLCVLVRQIPALNTSLPSTGFQTPTQQMKISEESNQLISTALLVMSDLPALCSPAGTVSILPTILFLSTGVIREMAAKSSESIKIPGCVTTALQVLKGLCSSQFTKDEVCALDWVKLLQSAMATVLDFSKPDAEQERPGLDECTLVLTLAVFILSSPKEVTCVPNLQAPVVEVFNQAWQSDSYQVRLKTLQTLTSIFLHPDRAVSTLYIHALSPKVIEFLTAMASSRPGSEVELSLSVEGIKMVETLVAIAEEDVRISMVSVFVPILISCLLEPEAVAGANQTSCALHDFALQRLMCIGPQYPKQFRAVMGAAPDLRQRLEAAVRAQQASSQSKKAAKLNAPNAKNALSHPAKPAIQLRTDFSNFTG